MKDRVKLGTTEIAISPLGIGTWAWGDPFVWGYGKESYGEADLQEAFEASHAGGINFFDTAEVYGLGKSEQFLGRFIRECKTPTILATKFMPFPFRLGKSALRRALHSSLDRLGLARVDLYQIHFPLPPIHIETWMDALADAVDAGLVRAVGVSNYSAAQMGRAYNALAARGIKLASNQVHYSLLHRQPEFDGILQLCRDLNVTLIAYSPLEMGILTGKYTPATPPSGMRARRYNSAYLERVMPLLDLVRQIGAGHDGKTPAQVALNWTICKGTVPIPGAKNARHAIANAGALGWRLTDAEIAALDRASVEVT
ncbi:MAG: aldo/keto reductase [Anaerolineae bacterium]|nr:aldo/keto reductase [Anaerolineae bacterium]